MRFFFKSIFYLAFFGMLGGWLFYSYIPIHKDHFVFVKSKVQGDRVLDSGSWWLFPERIIPHWVQTVEIPNKFSANGSVVVNFPYYEMLKQFASFSIKINYTLPFVWTPEAKNKLYSQKSEDIVAQYQEQVQFKLNEIIANTLNQTDLTDENLKATLTQNIQKEIGDIQLFFEKTPSINQYRSLMEQINQSINSPETSQKMINSKMDAILESNRLAEEQKQLERVLNFSVQFAKKIKAEDVDSNIVLGILDHLSKKPTS